jgi:geranylgeranyl pyrophosphate synthase
VVRKTIHKTTKECRIVGQEANKLPRIAVDVDPKLKKAMDKYISESGRSLRWVITTLVNKLLSGEVSLEKGGKS